LNPFDKTIRLANGVDINQLGFGTYKIPPGKECFDAVSAALEAGYRHIDTASFYENEESVGEAISHSGIGRKELFLATKLWNTDQTADRAMRSFEESLKRLGTDYLDMYLIHWPKPQSAHIWKFFERIYDEKLARAIGVCNFKEHHLEEIMSGCNVQPMINQVELHPMMNQEKLRSFCRERDIAVEAWSPLMRGRVMEDEVLSRLAAKYGKTVPQIVLRWNFEIGVITIPKSVHRERIIENAMIGEFSLEPSDVELINSLSTGMRVGSDPDDVYSGKKL
jgi:methylglyoxal/glyoxal reductase